MNPDMLAPGERCASTSNRNFEGRQGRGGRTHLVSPQMAAAAARPRALRRRARARCRGGAGMKAITHVAGPRRRARPGQRRHRPDHPEAVPQAGRAHGLRRVRVLRLALRRGRQRAARLRAEPARIRGRAPSWSPGATSAAARPASTRPGRSWTRLRVVIAPSFADIFRLTLPRTDVIVELPEERREGADGGGRPRRGSSDGRPRGADRDDAGGKGSRSRSTSRPATASSTVSTTSALTLQHEDAIAAYEANAARGRPADDPPRVDRPSCSGFSRGPYPVTTMDSRALRP